MKNQRLIRLLAPLVFVGLLSRFGAAAPAPDTAAPAVGQKAGKITALLPTAHIIRGEGKKAVTTDATRGEDVIWQDLVTTEKGGRARITLTDQSILSLGSQAQLRIVKHDARAQQTALEMTYGRVRAQVSTVTRDGGSFQLRTPTAVAGVIGTDFGTDASEPGITTFLCISGLVQVSNAEPAVSGSVPCAAGQTTTVKSGLPPTPPQPASQQQINQLITDTEPATISAFAPASALVGTTVDAMATGTHMAGINAVTITGAGVQIALAGNASETSATAHLVIAPTAQPGPRTVTFTKPNGANTAAVFTVIAPPGLQGTDAASLKKRYTDILTTELQAADSSNGSIKASLQQEADQGFQNLQQNDARLPQPLSSDPVSQQLTAILTNFGTANTNRETQAYNNAAAAIDQIVAAMLPKIQDGSEPAANIAADLDKQFVPINEAFQTSLNQIHTDLTSLAATQIQSIDQVLANFSQAIAAAVQQQLAPPTPKVDVQERTIEAGFQTSFDASSSSALLGATVTGTSWVLCDPSYRPAQVGVLLPANAAGCRAIPGFASSGGQFQFNTCSLNPADYIARVTVVDSNGKSSAMDVRLHVTQPQYDDPATRLQNLAAAYITLQSQQFLSFFDPTAYSGYTQLQQNIQQTFLGLSSMQINLRVSQSSITCNDATIRADWDQKYTFKGDQSCANVAAGTSCQKVLFTQAEQLTARMTRIPGKGWFITDFQGDNGKVQGVPPGPQTTFTPPPAGSVSLAVTAVSPFGQYIGQETGTVNVTIQNNGTATSTASTGSLVLTSPDFQSVLATGDVPAIQPGQSVTVPVTFTVPTSPGPHTVTATIAPAASGNTSSTTNATTASLTFAPPVGTFPAYVITSIQSTTSPNPPTGINAFNVGQTLNLQVTVANTGTASPTGSIVIGFTCTGPSQCAALPTTTIAAPAAGQSVTANIPAVNLQLPAGVGYVQTATITSASAQSSTAGNKANLTFDVTDFTLTNTLNFNGDLNVQIGGRGTFNVDVAELGGVSSYTLNLSAGSTITGVSYSLPSVASSSNQVIVNASSAAPAGTSALVTISSNSRFGVVHTATQSVRFFTASLENSDPGQPGSDPNNPIILPVNGNPQTLNFKLTGNFFNPGAGVQIMLPTSTGINITSPITVAAAGDRIPVTISAVQGAMLNQTTKLTFKAQIPNTNIPNVTPPQGFVSLDVYVRPIALPDLAITAVTAAGRNFSVNPWLSGEPVDFTVTVANNGPGTSQGFERLHLLLNGQELTRGSVTVPKSIAPNDPPLNVTVHAVAPDPVPTGSSTLVVKVDEDVVGDANPSNDSMTGPVPTSDWRLVLNGPGSGDNTSALVVPAGGSSAASITPKVVANNGNFLTPINLVNGVVSSRILASANTGTIIANSPIVYTINANANAAAGAYVAQLIARFVDAGHNTAQREATVHISVQNSNLPGDTVTVSAVSVENKPCTGCTPVQINGLLLEDVGLIATRSGGSTGSVDLHFTDPPSLISNVSSTGSFQSAIRNAVPYGSTTDVFFAAAQDATGAVTPGIANVIISATSVQTSAVRDGPTPQPVGPNPTMLQFSVGDLQLSSQPCFNIPPGGSGSLQLSFTPLSGFNVPSISWSVASLPPGVVLNSVTPSSTLGGGYPVSIGLTNTNPADITPSQPLTLVGTISNNNGSATVAFAPTVQLHSGACVPGGVRNAMIEGGTAGGTRGVWRRGTGSGSISRSSVIREVTVPTVADVRLVTADVSYTPSMPKVGDTVQVRFRLTNATNADARNIPVALVINGAAVASDTFDVGPGKTVLAGLQWNNAQLPRWGLTNGPVVASVVVDPTRNIRATIASGKVAPLTHFEFVGGGIAGSAPIQSLNGRQRALIELAESACTGFRFSFGAGGACASSDLEISLDDAAAGRFSFTSTRGISDLGLGYNSTGIPGGTQYSLQTVAAAGHSYAVQLDGGRVGVLTISAIHNPHQKSATADRVFRGRPIRVLRKMAPTGEPVDTGDVSGTAPSPDAVVLDVLYDTP